MSAAETIATVLRSQRDNRLARRFPAFTSLGCYPVLYLDSEDNVLCADCVRREVPDMCGLSRHHAPHKPYTPRGDVYWEGPPMSCDECGDAIESAYGDPEDPSDD